MEQKENGSELIEPRVPRMSERRLLSQILHRALLDAIFFGPSHPLGKNAIWWIRSKRHHKGTFLWVAHHLGFDPDGIKEFLQSENISRREKIKRLYRADPSVIKHRKKAAA